MYLNRVRLESGYTSPTHLKIRNTDTIALINTRMEPIARMKARNIPGNPITAPTAIAATAIIAVIKTVIKKGLATYHT